MTRWMIYGANGYTGSLIARKAVRLGMKPVLAGRNLDKLIPLADELDLEARAFPLDAHAKEGLAGISLVLHCAGPFRETSKPMLKACLEAGVHYLDITGEISVFEHTHAQHAKAEQSGVVVCSGVGFDVIPTDCAALRLKELMPDAAELALGFETDAGISPGTMKTMIEGLGSGSAERRDGVLMPIPLGSRQRTVDFGCGPRMAVAIPWGDVSAAFYTTDIPTITTWIPMSSSRIRGLRLLGKAGPVLASGTVQSLLKKLVDRRVSGPDDSEREQSPACVWGEVRNVSGEVRTVRIRTANAYDVTVWGSLEAVRRILEKNFPGGSYTPARLFGSGFIEELPGSGKFKVS